MHTIDDCPRCSKDFMYHQTDRHLFRTVLVGKNGNEHNEPIVICQDCHEIECIAEFIKEKADSRGWENAECMAVDKYGKEKTEKAMKFIDDNNDNK